MADIKEPRVNLILDALTARIEEDMASLYSAFVAKLLKAETGKQSTVIEEYIGDRFDVRARWYLSAVRKESHVEPYLAILDRTGKMDVEVLIAHFASSLPHRELVDARIVGRRFYWKSEAMRRVREKAALPRVASVTLPETAVGISNLAPSRPAPATPAPAEDPPKPEGAGDTVPNAEPDTESANQEAWRSRIEAALSPDQQTRLETLMARVAELLKEQATQHGGSVPARFYGITEALSTGDFFSMAPQDAYELLELTVGELTGEASAGGCNTTDRRAAVEAYIDEVFATTGKRITRTDIWKKAGDKSRAEFERWESHWYEKHGRKPNKAANRRFTRILTEKPHLK